ncbi:phytoene/squalene synthase family protein [Roseibium sp. MMSF_3544]|uniref:phytoene/squalene synthase family protein n=1 Tax=unclassified Roseibium TaxID=2629323 RepID=UPI00273D4AA9|nr:phytoene/squalene synthase family protein [Roseibium sp. MMSF_3544]
MNKVSPRALEGFEPFALHAKRPMDSSSPRYGLSRYRSDLNACTASIRKGSKSFHLASLLLPPETRKAAVALYAFCRHSDDLIDDPRSDRTSLEQLKQRLRLIYQGRPADYPCDRAFQKTVEDYAIPECIPLALLDGFAMDIANRRYQTLHDVKEYATGVAATVGLMMSLIMRTGEPQHLARAADLGIAMQLTNIARDVGEDARNGRIYLPLDWLEQQGINPETFLVSPRFSPELGKVVKRLLNEAERHYRLGHAGIAALPSDCQHAIRSAALIYEEIGMEIVANGYDSVTKRAHTGLMRKVSLLAAARRPAKSRAVSARQAKETAADPSAAGLVNAAARTFSIAKAKKSLQAHNVQADSASERLLCVLIRLQNESRQDLRFHKLAARQKAARLI